MFDIFPKDRNFTVDELVAQGHERKSIVLSLQKMETQGLGKFVIGRRGAKSRFEWFKQMAVPNTNRVPATSTPVVALPAADDWLAQMKGLKEAPVSKPELKSEPQLEPQYQVPLSKSKKERDPFLVVRDFREGVTQEQTSQSEKEMVERLSFITEFNGQHTFDEVCAHIEKLVKTLHQLEKNVVVEEPPGIVHVDATLIYGDGPGFWDWDTRKAIAKELATYRRGK